MDIVCIAKTKSFEVFYIIKLSPISEKINVIDIFDLIHLLQ